MKGGRSLSSSPAEGTQRRTVARVVEGISVLQKQLSSRSSAEESAEATTRNSPKEGKGNCSPKQSPYPYLLCLLTELLSPPRQCQHPKHLDDLFFV